MTSLTLIPIVAFVAVWALTGVLVRWNPRLGLLDRPGSRTSHTRTTPRGGGLAMVTVVLCGLLLVRCLPALDQSLTVALVGGGLLVAAVGFVDDLVTVPPRFRLVAHFAAVTWALWWLGGLPPMQIGERTLEFGWPGSLVAAVAMVWVINLFNFMDGIDGLASVEAVFVAAASSLFAFMANDFSTVPTAGGLIAAAAAGFLVWNWQPARIFMGDVGSGFLGFVLGTLSLATMRELPAAGFACLILGGAFVVDSTVTLVRRLLSGQPFYEAHRTHAYQWLARRWGAHRLVTLAFLAVNICWLLPMAWWCLNSPAWAPAIAAAALGPLVTLALLAGAGRTEGPSKA